MPEPRPDVTQLINDAAAGRADAPDQLIAAVYDQLRAAAQKQMAAERRDHTLAATALVHEAYLKLAGPREIPWQNRAHFYVAAAEAMRRILLDHAKSKRRHKRGGDARKEHLPLDAAATLPVESAPADNQPDFVALDEAMRRLESQDPRLAQVVRLKFYAGLEIAHVALVLGVSERTVKNDWAFAKAWLERALRESDSPDRS